jgi:hypothetical protein
MPRRSLILLTALVAALLFGARSASAQDAALCLGTADRVTSGEAIDEETKRKGHEACQRALAATSSVVQKYHLQEADFDIVGRPPKRRSAD